MHPRLSPVPTDNGNRVNQRLADSMQDCILDFRSIAHRNALIIIAVFLVHISRGAVGNLDPVDDAGDQIDELVLRRLRSVDLSDSTRQYSCLFGGSRSSASYPEATRLPLGMAEVPSQSGGEVQNCDWV